MLFDAVRRFVALSGQVGVKGSDPGVRELMATLRRSGFSSTQISELSGGKWSSTLVRQYTGDWGGVDDVLDSQRRSLIAALRELVSSGRGVGDIESVLSLDKSVRAKGSSLEEVAELNSNLGKLDLQRGEIGRLVKSSRELEEQRLTPGMVQVWITIDQELIADGFNKSARGLLHEACKKYSGVTETLKAFNKFDDLRGIQLECSRLEAEVDRLSVDKESLDLEIGQRRAMIEAANLAKINGFDLLSLTMISVLARDFGGPYKVAEAIRKYGSLKEMDEELEAMKAESEKVKGETSDKSQHLNALMYKLEEAKQVYYRNIDVRLVVELLANPRGIKMNRQEVVNLLSRVLDSGAQRIEENHDPLSIPSPAWDATVENIKVLEERLRSFIDVEAKAP